jgi:hypothetical protein
MRLSTLLRRMPSLLFVPPERRGCRVAAVPVLPTPLIKGVLNFPCVAQKPLVVRHGMVKPASINCINFCIKFFLGRAVNSWAIKTSWLHLELCPEILR